MLVVAAASAVQASLGFGAALLSAPILLLLHPAFAPGPIIASTFVLTVLVARRERASIDFVGLPFIVGGRFAGVALAALLLVDLSRRGFDLLFGALVLAAVGLSLLGRQLPRTRLVLTAAGVASGLMGTISSIGGPPVALVYPHDDPARFRATLSAHFIIGGVVSLAALFAVGRFGATELALSALLAPAAGAGFWLSRHAVHRVDAARLRGAVLALSACAALGVLFRSIASAGR